MRVATDVETRDRLVVEHLSLVKALAQRLAMRLPAHVEVSELVSVGVLGLVDAAGRYQPSLGVPFDAFARRRIMGAMLDALRELDWAPRSLRRTRRDIDSTIAALRHRLGREPKEEEIAEAMGVGTAELGKTLEQLRSLEVGVVRQAEPGGDQLDPLDLLVDPDEGALARLERADLRRHLASAIKQLPERERNILAFYYEEELTLAEIGKVLGVSESRVCQLRSLAISRLRSALQQTFAPVEAVR